jgi:hypothetical protein
MKRHSGKSHESSILDITDEEILLSDGEEQFFMGEEEEELLEGLDQNFIEFQETKENLIAQTTIHIDID